MILAKLPRLAAEQTVSIAKNVFLRNGRRAVSTAAAGRHPISARTNNERYLVASGYV